MSILKGALGLLAAGATVAAYKVARATKEDEPGVALGAVVVGALTASAAAHALTDEVRELRDRGRRAKA